MMMVCCILLGLILLGSLVGVTLHFCYFWLQWPDIAGFVDDKKCPACYGIEFCPEFYAGNVVFYKDFQSTLSNYVNAKNVYSAKYSKAGGSVVVKKLGQDWELKSLDTKACQMFGSGSDCNFDNLTMIDLWDDIIRMVEYNGRHGNAYQTGLTLCPTTDGIFELLKPYEVNNTHGEKILLANVWSILSINPEPILLKYLNADSPKWPVPQFYGACGRAIVQQDCGLMLSSFLSEPWLYRAQLAINLLEMASVFTFNHTRFRFYLTDITSDNIVLKNWGANKNIPMMVDMENVIVLDKESTVFPEDTWPQNHRSEVIECSGCFAFSTEDICRHHLSDHNYYSICKLLKDEVLAEVPQFVLQKSPDFPQILRECVAPSRGQADRFAAAQALDTELKNILKIFVTDKPNSNDV